MTFLEFLPQQILLVLEIRQACIMEHNKSIKAQMDRWNIVSTLNYLPFEKELEIILAKIKVLIIKREKRFYQI